MDGGVGRLGKAERQRLIASVVQRKRIGTQLELLDALAKVGCRVTQATVSRDIREMGVQKGADNDGRARFILPTPRVRRSPSMPRAHAQLGTALRTAGDREGAKREFEATLKLDPQHRAARTNLGNLYYEAAGTQADSAAARGLFERAVTEYEQVLKTDPEYKEALNSLGSAYLRLGRVAEAGQVYQQVVSLSPNFPEGYYNLGLALVRQGQYRPAIAAYQQALRLHPDADTWCSLGEALLLDGQQAQQQGAPDGGRRQWQEATGSFQQALALEPGNTRAVLRLRQLQQGGSR